jgi:hypothetical protein
MCWKSVPGRPRHAPKDGLSDTPPQRWGRFFMGKENPPGLGRALHW